MRLVNLSVLPKSEIHFSSIFIFNNFYFLLFTVLQKAFNSFDHQKSGSIPCDMVADILRLMGQPFNKKILDELIEEVDADSKLIGLLYKFN